MNDFSITLRLDTPLLQSGVASGKVDPSNILRGPSVRGLLHTWARALFGPFLGGNVELTRGAENLLLGSAAGGKGRPTFRLAVQSEPWEIEEYENSPKSSTSQRLFRGKRYGHKPGPLVTCKILFQPRSSALKGPSGSLFVETLMAVAWLSFSLGAIGNRSRRGYGSLTVKSCSSFQSSRDEPAECSLSRWPVFDTPPKSREALATGLDTGIQKARESAKKWLRASGCLPDPEPPPAMEFGFFQLRTTGQVFVGSAFKGWKGWKVAMQALMESCHQEKGSALYGDTMGSSDPRIASPLWVRFYQVSDGYIPIMTWAPRPLSPTSSSVTEKKRYVHVAAVVSSLTGVSRPDSVSALSRSAP